MPRPKNKSELIHLSNENFQKLSGFIEKLSSQEQEEDFHGETMNRNIRDVLAHLHHWHLMLLTWYDIGMAGDKPDMPAKGYTWKTVPELNRKIWEQNKDTALADVKTQLNQSFESVQKLIQQHSDDELFEKKKYKWTGSTSLGAYLISATSSHYDWALKLIKKGRK